MSREQPSIRSVRPHAAVQAWFVNAAVLVVVGCGPVEPPGDGTPGEGTGDKAIDTDRESRSGDAMGEGRANGDGDGDEPSLVHELDLANAPLRALATLPGVRGPCTGVLVRASDHPDAPAYFLTAGRCVLEPTSPHAGVVVGAAVDSDVIAKFAQFHVAGLDSTADAVAMATRIAYAALKGVDLAVLELDRTRAELAVLGIDPLPLNVSPAAVGDPLRLVWMLQNPGVDSGNASLRVTHCENLRSADVVEHHFMWFDEMVSRCAGVGSGAAGAPILNETGEVVAIHHSVSAASGPAAPCFFGSPCEVGDNESERAESGNTYAVQLSKLQGCFAADGRFDVGRDGCRLDRGIHVDVEDKPPLLMAPSHARVWGAEIGSEELTHYRFKTGALKSTDCRDEAGYSGALPLEPSNQVLDSLPLPEEDGLHVLCVVGGSGPVDGPGWQGFDNPTVMVTRLYEHRPRLRGSEVIDLTPQQTFDIAYDVTKQYELHARSAKATLSVTTHWDDSLTMDIRKDREWRIENGLNAVQTGRTTPDVIALLMCHEVGHALGGFPFKLEEEQTRQVAGLKEGLYGTVSSTEGESDYFAAKECLPRLWAEETELNASFRATASAFVKSQCDAVWGTSAEQDICYRVAATAEAFGRWLRHDGSFRVDTPSSYVVTGVVGGYPSTQCRVDTIFQGGLCRTKFRGTAIPGLIEPYEQLMQISPAVEAAAAPDSCTAGVGSRPPCWFKPNARPFDCSGFPELGHCVIENGEHAYQTCSVKAGIETFPCGVQQCSLDDAGFPYCGSVGK